MKRTPQKLAFDQKMNSWTLQDAQAALGDDLVTARDGDDRCVLHLAGSSVSRPRFVSQCVHAALTFFLLAANGNCTLVKEILADEKFTSLRCARDSGGRTPLLVAVEQHQRDTVALLLDTENIASVVNVPDG